MKVKTYFNGCDYITAGKEYKIFNEEYNSKGELGAFEFTDDAGDNLYSSLTGTLHLKGGDWIIVDASNRESPSLRDHFAGLAIQGITSQISKNAFKEEVSSFIQDKAELAYKIADAMLKVREEK